MDFTPILDNIVPKTNISKKVESFLHILSTSAKKCQYNCIIQVGGSIAKNTYLAGDYDCDVFVRFEKSQKDISQALDAILRDTGLAFERIHGSRDYFQLEYEDIFFEIVPVYYITDPSDAKNVTDVSPLHVLWAQEYGKELTNDIRLAKAFCKAQRVYGAESYIGGFSGHVLDILVINYGGFEKMLQAVAKWDKRTILDPANHYDTDPIKELDISKTLSPLIIIDPIQPNRNAASAVSAKRYEQFIQVAKAFVKNPSLDYFEKRPYTLDTFSQEEGEQFCFELVPMSGKKDIVGAKMKKASNYLLRQAELYGFVIKDADFIWEDDHAKTFIILESTTLPAQRIQQGPYLSMSEQADTFRKKHSLVFEKDDRLFAKVKRLHTTFSSFLAEYSQHNEVTSRVDKITF